MSKQVKHHRTVRVPLVLTPAQVEVVRETMRIASSVFSKHVDYIMEHKTISRKQLHENVYPKAREQYSQFPSALVQAVRDTTVESIKAINTKHPKHKFNIRPEKKAYSGLRLDARTFTLRGDQVTFSTIEKRIRTIISIPSWFEERYPEREAISATLSYDKRRKQVFLNLVFSVTSQASSHGEKIVGIDRGLYSIATTSEGGDYKARKTREVRRRYLYNRRVLQQKGTPSAKRKLRKLSGKEKRFMRDTNHVITKELANDPTVNTYVLEDLNGIRSQRRGKKMNTWLSQWSFHQFETQLKYKSELNGIQVVFVDPRYTSQKCSRCKNIDKRSRVKNKYSCVKCGFKAHADHNAAMNIRDNYILSTQLQVEQAVVNQPIVTSITA